MMRPLRWCLALLVLAANPGVRAQAPNPAPAAATPGNWQASGDGGAVAAGGLGAVDAGIATLRAGGNATDAAVATILALAVTDGTQFCFGGEVPILIHDAATGTTEVIAGMGAAPALATLEHFQRPEGIPAKGLESAAVPAALDACLVALERHGTLTFARAAAPMLALLDQHKEPWHADLARTVRTLIEAENQSPGDRRRGLRLVADAFYRGPIARRIDAWSREHGGLLRYHDLAKHFTRVEEPAAVTYRGHTILKCGPWTQGPSLLQALQILEGFDLAAMGHDSPDAVHTSVEALKLALADRDAFFADPLFVDVPLDRLLKPTYAAARRALIDPKTASLRLRPGDPWHDRPELDHPATPLGDPGARGTSDTTTCVVADRHGNLVAATPSGWSGVVAGNTGVWLGTRLQSFNAWPNHPNRIVPGKRPRITLTPTIVLDRNRAPLLAISVAGGDNQEQMTLQLVLNAIDFGLEPSASVTAPRWMSDHFIGSFRQAPPKPGGLRINPSYPAATLATLQSRGHLLAPSATPLAAAPVVISRNPTTGRLHAAGDPKAGRHASAY
ncbi:MAG: gamma-glutamyltransferase [Isosphaeraceae bacterium]